jgi:hypothetical protein
MKTKVSILFYAKEQKANANGLVPSTQNYYQLKETI